MNVSFRPHHFLCAYCFKGSGYSAAFVENFTTIMSTLATSTGDQIEITITNHTDSICSPCPHKRETLCTSQEKITSLDKAHLRALKLENMQKITWGEAKTRITTHITPAIFNEICAPCEWKKLGICATRLGFSI